jgi:hypothetical protein
MTEEFTRHVAMWVEAPAGRGRAGRTVPVNVQLPKGWSLGAIDVAYEKFPRPLTPKEIKRRSSYAYPKGAQTLLPLLPRGFQYTNGTTGEVVVADGVARAKIALLSGPGSYWVLVYAAPGATEGKTLSPITAVRILAD